MNLDLSNYYGMDLRDLDVTTPEQAEGLRNYYRDAKNTIMPEYEFWLKHRPDVAKRRILFNMLCRSDEARMFMLPSLMGWIAYYILVGYKEGVVYQIANAQKVGAPRALIEDAFAVAQLYGDLHRTRTILTSGADEYLASYEEPEPRSLFPESWMHDPAAFASGLDFTSPTVTSMEREKLVDWYRRVLGEVPAYVDWMLAEAPEQLKTYRLRFESALSAAPKQVMPYLMIHLNLLFGLREGVREAFLLGRGFEMTREQLMDGIGRMVSYGGMAAVSTVAEVAYDIFESYE